MRRTVPERVNEYIKKHPEVYSSLLVVDMNDIMELGNMFDIIATAFAHGYMKASKAKKGGAKS